MVRLLHRNSNSTINLWPFSLDFSIQNMYRDRAGESRTGLPLVVLSLIEQYVPE
jgi:hypothetical protein